MKKLIYRGIAALMMLLTVSITAQAQSPDQLPKVPADPQVRIGKLDNGLTYFIRHNNNPKGQADFYIAQKVGSILEEDNQRGLAHFLEHMCFNGTENFPEKGIIEYLESIGVKFGVNLNAYTSVDETVYNISNVPVARTGVQDSCLLILHDWACALTLDPKEIDAERGVIHEEWRRSMAGSMRIIENVLPTVFPDSRYGYRLPIGTMEVVDNFPPQAIRDYYHTWYRPDQQGIIVVGDIDPDYIEAKIKELFGPIPMPENAKERKYFEVEDTPGTIFALGQDKEMQVSVMMLMFKSDQVMLPREYRDTEAYLPTHYMTTIIEEMLNGRLKDLANKPETEFAQAEVEFGEMFLAKTKGALTLQVVAKDNDVVPAMQQAYRELLRAARFGFTVGEYERARAEFLANIEKQYEERNDVKNETYVEQYVDFFVDNVPAPGIEYEKQKYDQYAGIFTVDMINQFLPSVVIDDNRILIGMFPEKEGFTMPTDTDFEKAFESVDDEELEGYKDEMRTDPLIPVLPTPGKVTATKHLDEWDATEYTLSNGVKVIVKPTNFKNNEVRFEAIAKGKGVASLDQSLKSDILTAEMALESYGIHNYTNSDIQKYLQGKKVKTTFSYDRYSRDFEGESTSKDLGTLMEMIYGYFTGLNFDEQEFAAMQSSYAGILENQANNPQFIFQKYLMETLYKAESLRMPTSDDIRKADRQKILDILKPMLANAAEYTFVFVGSIDENTFVPMLEQYIATLPADNSKLLKDIVYNPDFEFAPGSKTSTFTTKMENPQSWVCVMLSGNMPYTAKNKLMTSIASQILSKRLLNKVREEMGATYSIGCGANMSRQGLVNTFFQIPFPMKPEMKDEALAAIKDIVTSMTSNVTEDELKPIIEYMVKKSGEDLNDNEAWTGAIAATQLNGVQTFTNTVEVLNTITTADVQNFMADVLKQDNYRVIVLDPEGVQEAAN